jgi:Putative Flp pilus-assembly TadE/G-like
MSDFNTANELASELLSACYYESNEPCFKLTKIVLHRGSDSDDRVVVENDGQSDWTGQTILLVAISIVSLLAMAALAIDVVTLYVARGETQRAADAAALAAAKAIADSSYTTLSPGDGNLATTKTLAQTMATASVNAILPHNRVAGMQPTIVGTPSFTYPATPPNSNPHVAVTLQVTNLPTFFARIWGPRAITASATATAEVYNPANITTQYTPITPRNVKPWLVANKDPIQGNQFVNTTTWEIETGVVAETFNLTLDCNGPPYRPPCGIPHNPPGTPSANQVEYVPAQVTANANNVCPSLCTGGSDYEQSIECADANTYAYLNCGGGATNIMWDNTVNPGGRNRASASGARCLIHALGTGTNQGQDILDPSPWPNNPMQITAQSGPLSGNVVSTSNSIVTVPVIDTTTPLPAIGGNVTIIGFLQGFINWVAPGPGDGTHGDMNLTVLNVVGCNANANGANAVVGGTGTSPIPVRLITPP